MITIEYEEENRQRKLDIEDILTLLDTAADNCLSAGTQINDVYRKKDLFDCLSALSWAKQELIALADEEDNDEEGICY